ncbi:MAG: hypothetical protein ABEJ59_05980 [Halanaeroarchaeum sp.]
MDLRTLAAAVLGIAVGVLFVAAPDTLVQIQTAGRIPSERHGEYGTDATTGRWRRLVQAVGVALLFGGLYFAWTLV